MSKKRVLYKSIIFLFIFLQSAAYFLSRPAKVDTASLTSASATLSNSRLSYRAGINSGTSGSSLVTIDSSGNADNDTDHLFPSDVICIADATFAGCQGQTTYTVNNIVDSTNFGINTPLSATLGQADLAIATQSGTLTIAVTTANAVPSNGDILVTIPSINHATQGNDGFPDTNSAVSGNGFDLNSIGTGDITVGSSGCANNWTVSSVAAGDVSNDHRIRIDRSTNSCAAGSTITITVGDGAPNLINPAPITSGHTQGTSDIYTINVITRDGSDNQIDTVDVDVAPIEAVLVSATVDETLTFTIAGVSSSSTAACDQTMNITTTAMSVPFGTLINTDTFTDGAQLLTLSTNADGGYSVRTEENDQLGRNGNTCTGASAGESVNCIEDTTCDGGSCSSSSEDDWETATNNGFGYSLKNASGSDAAFQHNVVSGSCAGTASSDFCARQFPDQEASESKQTIMSNAGPVSSSQVYVCYRTTISATQPAGYYYNKIKYTATAVF